MLFMLTTLCSCTKELPEFVGTNCEMQIVGEVITNPDCVNLKVGVQLSNLENALDEDITKVELCVNGEVTTMFENVKVADIASGGNTSVTKTIVIKDIPYNKKTEYDVYATFYSESSFTEKVVSEKYVVFKDKVQEIIEISSGTPYDRGYTSVKIPLHLNMLDSCISAIGVNYSCRYKYGYSYSSINGKVELTMASGQITSKDVDILLSCLPCGVTIYYECYVKSVSGDIKRTKELYTEIPSVRSGEAVDLGLSVKWPSYNIGSFEGSEKNWYFRPAKLNTSIVGTNYDLAALYWGGNWNMPTKEQLEELCRKCKLTKTKDGYEVVGPNGNSIFIPAIGYLRDSYIKGESYAYLLSGECYYDQSSGKFYVYALILSGRGNWRISGVEIEDNYYPLRAVLAY